MKSNAPVLKIVMAGTGAVGKSALTLRFMYDEVMEDYEPTKADSYRKAVVLDNEPVQLDILDTAGQEEFVSVAENYFRTCAGALLVFDATVPETLEKLHDHWETMCRVKDSHNPVAVVLANKIDKKEQIDKEALRAGREFAQQHELPFFETSAITNINVNAAYECIAREIRRRQLTDDQSAKPPRKQLRKRCTLL